jgi:hypothetical protein
MCQCYNFHRRCTAWVGQFLALVEDQLEWGFLTSSWTSSWRGTQACPHWQGSDSTSTSSNTTTTTSTSISRRQWRGTYLAVVWYSGWFKLHSSWAPVWFKSMTQTCTSSTTSNNGGIGTANTTWITTTVTPALLVVLQDYLLLVL